MMSDLKIETNTIPYQPLQTTYTNGSYNPYKCIHSYVEEKSLLRVKHETAIMLRNGGTHFSNQMVSISGWRYWSQFTLFLESYLIISLLKKILPSQLQCSHEKGFLRSYFRFRS